MNSLRLLPVLLALGLVAGCNKTDASDTMKTPGETAKGAVDSVKVGADKAAAGAMGAMDSLKNMDFSKMEPAKLAEAGKNVMSDIASRLGNIKDLASAKTVKETLEPMMDKLGSLKTSLNGKLPNMEAVTTAITKLKAEFPSGSEVMNLIKPMLDKLSNLVG